MISSGRQSTRIEPQPRSEADISIAASLLPSAEQKPTEPPLSLSRFTAFGLSIVVLAISGIALPAAWAIAVFLVSGDVLP